jgi:hypothetical protein
MLKRGSAPSSFEHAHVVSTWLVQCQASLFSAQHWVEAQHAWAHCRALCFSPWYTDSSTSCCSSGTPAVSPNNVNLCQAVQRVLAAARRTRGVEAQLRLLARQQRDTLLQLEAAREAEARSARHWQVRGESFSCSSGGGDSSCVYEGATGRW